MRSLKRLVLSVLASAVAASTWSAPASASGSGLDPSFGNGGTLVLSSTSSPRALVIDANGDYLVALTGSILRLQSNGSPDTSFASGGTLALPFSTMSLALQADGKLLVVGVNTNASTVLARYNANGSADLTFGSAGQVSTSISADVALEQANGQILVGGAVSGPPVVNRRLTTYTALARYNADGSVDASFGSGGSVIVNAIGSVYTIALESDGSILALNPVGFTGVGSSAFLARFTSAGVEEALGLSGSVVASASTAQYPGFMAAFQSNGDVVAATFAPGNGKDGRYGELLRFTVQGASDPTFNSPVFDWGAGLPQTKNIPQAMAIAPSGKIAAVGIAAVTNNPEIFGVGAFNSDGSLDGSFAQNGLTSTSFGSGLAQALSVAFQADGKLVVLGEAGSAIALARYLAP